MNKKQFYKRLWLYLITAIIIIGMLSGCGNSNSASETNPEPSQAPVDIPAESEHEEETSFYKSGQYKVGTDLPEGEYVLITDSAAYFEVTKDSTGEFSSIIANDNFDNRTIVTVVDGQYIKTQNCEMYPYNDAPKAETKDGYLSSGMYKVGDDLPAGEYKVIAEGSGYTEINNSSRHNMSGIVSNDNFEGEQYIDIKDGQYIKLVNAKIKIE